MLLYESADCFSDAERAAIALALAAGEVPNAATRNILERGRTFQASDNPNDCRHIRLRILNRWNDTVATLEERMEFAALSSSTGGWQLGKHA